MKSLLKLSLLVLALFLGHTAFAAGEVSQIVGTVQVPANLNADDAQRAVAFAFSSRQWTVTEQSNSKVVGYLKHRSNEAQMTCLIKDGVITMECWGYEINKSTGARLEPELPEGWIKFMKRSIIKNLNDLALRKY